MVLAFDGRAFCRGYDSIDRVLRVLVRAAQHAGWQFEIWTEGDLRPDAVQFREWARPAIDAADSAAEVLWSPDTGVLPCKLPAVATLHDVNPLLPDGRNNLTRWLRKHRFNQRVEKCLARTNQLVTDTQDAKQRIMQAFPSVQDRVSLVPLFADPDIKPLKGPEGDRIIRDLGLEPGFILSVGSLRRHKNWARLIRAYAALPVSLRKTHGLVFAGRARRARPEPERLATELGVRERVRILGVIDEGTLHALYGAASLLACPSLMEGFGFPALEAMACGVPVVATNRTCVPEVLGDAATYVDPTSIENITDGLALVLGDARKREAMIDAGTKRAAEYNPARTARAMADVLDHLSRQSSAPPSACNAQSNLFDSCTQRNETREANASASVQT
jgi:glycosyltransferase involved in cell wall biosynthesis